MKCSSFSRLAGCHNKSLVCFNYFFTNCQPYARAFVFAMPVKTLKYIEDFIGILRFKSYTRIANAQMKILFVGRSIQCGNCYTMYKFTIDDNMRMNILFSEFYSVADNIAE